MIVLRSEDPRWLSNSWLIADRPGGSAVLVDAGAPPAPLLAALEERALELTHVLLTHHHVDHVVHAPTFVARSACVLCAHANETAWLPGPLAPTRILADGEELRAGELTIRALHVPGHTAGQLAFLVDEERVFTGDTLFRGSVGGTRAPGHTDLDDLRRSILDVLLRLPPETIVHPGHREETSVSREWRENPFVRAWRGLDAPRPEACTALGEPATLLLRAADYDGGTKCWVRFASGREDVVPGSRVGPPAP